MLITASLGGMMAWLAGPSKGLLLIGRKEGYLPPFFQKVNPAGIQVNILFAQGIIVTIIALLFALIPNVSSVYWIFSVITTQVYLIMYFLMFISAMRLRKSQPDHPRGYRAPILPVLAIVGLVSSVARSSSASCRRRSSAAAAPPSTCSSSAAACSSSAC